MDDNELLALAETTLTEIKIADGLSERHAAVLAALRIRLKGSDGGSLEDLLAAAENETPITFEKSEAEVQTAKQKPTLDDLFNQEPAPKPDWPG